MGNMRERTSDKADGNKKAGFDGGNKYLFSRKLQGLVGGYWSPQTLHNVCNLFDDENIDKAKCNMTLYDNKLVIEELQGMPTMSKILCDILPSLSEV